MQIVRADGSRRLVKVLDENRFHATRLAECIAGQDGETPVPAVAEWCCVSIAREFFDLVPDESQGLTSYVVHVRDWRGVVRAVSLRRASRRAAIAAAEYAIGGTAISVRARFRVAGHCQACDVPLFFDLRLRRSGDGWKCLDCP